MLVGDLLWIVDGWSSLAVVCVLTPFLALYALSACHQSTADVYLYAADVEGSTSTVFALYAMT